MNKFEKLYKLFTYMREVGQITTSGKDRFIVKNINLLKIPDVDMCDVHVDFAINKLTQYTALINGHNGDPFSERDINIDLSKIDELYDVVYKRALEFLGRKRIAEKAAAEKRNSEIETRRHLDNIISH